MVPKERNRLSKKKNIRHCKNACICFFVLSMFLLEKLPGNLFGLQATNQASLVFGNWSVRSLVETCRNRRDAFSQSRLHREFFDSKQVFSQCKKTGWFNQEFTAFVTLAFWCQKSRPHGIVPVCLATRSGGRCQRSGFDLRLQILVQRGDACAEGVAWARRGSRHAGGFTRRLDTHRHAHFVALLLGPPHGCVPCPSVFSKCLLRWCFTS